MKKRKAVRYQGFNKAKKMHKYWRKQGRKPGLMTGDGSWWHFKINEK